MAALVSVSEEVRCRCHLKYHNNNHFTNNLLPNLNDNNTTAGNSNGQTKILTQSPSNNSLFDEQSNGNNSNAQNGSNNVNKGLNGIRNNSNNNLNILSSLQQPKRQRSCDIIDSRALILAKSKNLTGYQQANYNMPVTSTKPSNTLSPAAPVLSLTQFNSLLSINSATNLLNPYSSGLVLNSKLQKSITIQNQQLFNNHPKTMINGSAHGSYQYQRIQANQTISKNSSNNTVNSATLPSLEQSNAETASRINVEANVLLDAEVINDYPTQALLLTVLATLVRNSTDENEIRILYQYIAEASIIFSKVFPVIHNLLDSKINHIIQLSLDESILDSVQSIIQNMISSCELNDSNQQQLSYLQSCGFGGLWRFAQPFATGKEKPENVELFVDCLEAMVETCLPSDEDSFAESSCHSSLNSTCTLHASNPSQMNTQSSFSNLNQSVSNFINRSNINLITGSMSSISMSSIHSPTDLLFEVNDLTNLVRTGKFRRNSSPKN